MLGPVSRHFKISTICLLVANEGGDREFGLQHYKEMAFDRADAVSDLLV